MREGRRKGGSEGGREGGRESLSSKRRMRIKEIVIALREREGT